MTKNGKLAGKLLLLAIAGSFGYLSGVNSAYAFECNDRGCQAWAEGYCDNGHGGLDGEASWDEPSCSATCEDGASKSKDSDSCGGPPPV